MTTVPLKRLNGTRLIQLGTTFQLAHQPFIKGLFFRLPLFHLFGFLQVLLDVSRSHEGLVLPTVHLGVVRGVESDGRHFLQMFIGSIQKVIPLLPRNGLESGLVAKSIEWQLFLVAQMWVLL